MTRIEARPGETVADVNPAASAGQAPAAEANGNEPAKSHKGPPKKEDHPLVAAGTKLTSIPEDYDPKKHSVLKEDNFDGNKLDVFYNWKASEYQAKADEWKEKAAAFARFGGIADKKTAQKVSDSLATMKKSLEALAAQGVDLSGFDRAILEACGMAPAATE